MYLLRDDINTNMVYLSFGEMTITLNDLISFQCTLI